jgi:hypothetical protein
MISLEVVIFALELLEDEGFGSGELEEAMVVG